MMVVRILSLFFLVHSGIGANEYYWRDYEPSQTHQIPSDAFIAGNDVNLENIYVGQTNIFPHAGVHPATISPGKEVWAAYGGPQKATNFIQILCSEHTDRFKWIATTSKTLHLAGLNTHVVRGGLDQDHITYIGRVKYQGNIVIGKVYTHDVNNSDMVFIFNNREYRVNSFEILTYN